jgi:hypothetical protein
MCDAQKPRKGPYVPVGNYRKMNERMGHIVRVNYSVVKHYLHNKQILMCRLGGLLVSGHLLLRNFGLYAIFMNMYVVITIAMVTLLRDFGSWIMCVYCRFRWPRGHRRWGRGFESRSRHGCFSSSLCVVMSCVSRGLCDRRSPTECLKN